MVPPFCMCGRDLRKAPPWRFWPFMGKWVNGDNIFERLSFSGSRRHTSGFQPGLRHENPKGRMQKKQQNCYLDNAHLNPGVLSYWLPIEFHHPIGPKLTPWLRKHSHFIIQCQPGQSDHKISVFTGSLCDLSILCFVKIILLSIKCCSRHHTTFQDEATFIKVVRRNDDKNYHNVTRWQYIS